MTEDAVLTFVTTSIRSVWALELLLFLKRNQGLRWDADQLILELRSSPVVINEALAFLKTSGFVIQDNGRHYQYRATSPMLDEVVAALERLYSAKPIAVINAIARSPGEQLKNFSDAFKLKD